MKVRWLMGGLEIPGIGMSQTGKIANLDNSLAEDFIKRGIAESIKAKKEEKKIVVNKRGEE